MRVTTFTPAPEKDGWQIFTTLAVGKAELVNHMVEVEENVPEYLSTRASAQTRATRFQVGPWKAIKVNYGITMQKDEQKALSARLADWVECFPREPGNLATKLFGAQSALVRFDYVYTPRVGPRIFEVDDRPAGIHLVSMHNGKFKDGLSRCVYSWEEATGRPLAICISEERRGSNDDELWAEQLLHRRSIPVHIGVPDQAIASRYAWWVRSNRDEVAFTQLTKDALAPIELEGDKSYGLHMGLWHPIRNIADLPLENGCVLKPRAGSRFEAVQLVRGDHREPGFITVSRALKEIADGRFAYWQPFYAPEDSKRHSMLRDDYRLIRRVYFAHLHKDNSRRPNFICLGGCWMATPNHRVHGTAEALSGPIYSHSQDWQ